MSPEVIAEISQLRSKIESGTASLDDCKRAVILMRGDRKGAAVASETSRRAKVKAEVKHADEMLDELGDL